MVAMWQDTGVTVHAVELVRVSAAGTWRNGAQVLTAVGDATQPVTGPNCPLPGAPLLALVGRIGAAAHRSGW